MQSALYTGWVRHQRSDTLKHRFQYRVYMSYIDLDELRLLEKKIVGFSARRFAPIWLRRRDHDGNPEIDLRRFVLAKLKANGVEDEIGPVRLLTNLRWFGHCFNPISVFYCFTKNGEQLRACVLEVTNTPWGERHCYVVEISPSKEVREFEKTFHVSPFLTMDMRYRAYLATPRQILSLALNNIQSQNIVHRASLVLQRQEFTSASIWRTGLSHVSATLRTKWRIHWQALRLFLKGAKFITHPKKGATTKPTINSDS